MPKITKLVSGRDVIQLQDYANLEPVVLTPTWYEAVE